MRMSRHPRSASLARCFCLFSGHSSCFAAGVLSSVISGMSRHDLPHNLFETNDLRTLHFVSNQQPFLFHAFGHHLSKAWGGGVQSSQTRVRRAGEQQLQCGRVSYFLFSIFYFRSSALILSNLPTLQQRFPLAPPHTGTVPSALPRLRAAPARARPV